MRKLFKKELPTSKLLLRNYSVNYLLGLRRKKIDSVEIYLHAKNPAAIKTWKKFGFSIDVHRMRKMI